MLCVKCKKRQAILFVTKIENNQQTQEGYCIQCARELNIGPVNQIMEKMGITVIFLFNYQKKYSKIYSSWDDIYSCFDVPIHHDTAVGEYQMPTMQNPSNALACALGELCEERYAVGKLRGTERKEIT